MTGREGYTHANVVTPHDSNVLAVPCEALMFNTTGNAVLIMPNGVTVTIAVVAGTIYMIRPSIVKTTGHTAGVVTALA